MIRPTLADIEQHSRLSTRVGGPYYSDASAVDAPALIATVRDVLAFLDRHEQANPLGREQWNADIRAAIAVHIDITCEGDIMIDRYEAPHPRADECPHAGVGKACGPCRELFQRGPFTCPRCYKVVTLRMDGCIRHHTNGIPEFPGAPFSQRCPASGTTYEEEID